MQLLENDRRSRIAGPDPSVSLSGRAKLNCHRRVLLPWRRPADEQFMRTDFFEKEFAGPVGSSDDGDLADFHPLDSCNPYKAMRGR